MFYLFSNYEALGRLPFCVSIFWPKNGHDSTYHTEFLNELVYVKYLEYLVHSVIEVIFLVKMSVSGG